MGELVADVGAAIEDYDDNYNMFTECKELREGLGGNADRLAPMIFRVVCDVVANDRFVSMREASYLSAMSRRLEVPLEKAKSIFKEVMAQRRGRLEAAASQIDETLNAKLKEFLDFSGAEDMVGELDADSLGEMINAAAEGQSVSQDDLTRSLAILGLKGNAKLGDAEAVWRETIENLNLPKLVDQGATFVSAAIKRIGEVNEAYKTILDFHKSQS
jgi:hypothetical protein